MFHVLRTALAAADSWLIQDLAELGVAEAQKATILQDFTRVRAYVWTVLVVKTSFWLQLPWVLFGLGHPNLEERGA